MKRTDKKKAIIRAAEGLFKTRRFHEITLDEVARRARVGKGTIYLYFKDKDELFFQTATAGFDELCRLLEEQVPGEGPFTEQLGAATTLITRFFASRRQLFRMMMESHAPRQHEAFHQRWREQHQQLLAAVAKIMMRGVADHTLRTDLPPDLLAALFLGLLRARAMERPELPPEQNDFQLVIDLFCHGACRK